jgi:hypothetical protein
VIETVLVPPGFDPELMHVDKRKITQIALMVNDSAGKYRSLTDESFSKSTLKSWSTSVSSIKFQVPAHGPFRE